jgi:hypothetical protein
MHLESAKEILRAEAENLGCPKGFLFLAISARGFNPVSANYEGLASGYLGDRRDRLQKSERALPNPDRGFRRALSTALRCGLDYQRLLLLPPP